MIKCPKCGNTLVVVVVGRRKYRCVLCGYEWLEGNTKQKDF
jgi:transposase-like protein